MPCPHMEINIVKRAEGQSAVNAAAYQTGEKLYSERDRRYMYNGTKEELIMKEILLPPHAPPEFADRKTLWNSVEAAEKNWNSQLARRMKITLPKELSMEDNIALAKEYCQKEFVSKGMIADLAIHDPDPPNHNPHFHVLLTIRPLDENGKWAPKAHKEYLLDQDGNRIRGPDGKFKTRKVTTVDWNDRRKAEIWRHDWEILQNEYLERAGRQERVSMKSYERQGIDKIPTVHMGPAVAALEKKGIRTDVGDLNREIKVTNRLIRSLRDTIRKLTSWLVDIRQAIREIEMEPEEVYLVDLLGQKFDQRANERFLTWRNRHAAGRAGLADLKRFAVIVNYMQQNRVLTIEDLDGRLTSICDRQHTLRDGIRKDTKRMAEIEKIQATARRRAELDPIHDKYRKTYIGKSLYQKRHKAELEEWNRCNRFIRARFPDGKCDLRTLSDEHSRLSAEMELKNEQLQPILEELDMLRDIQWLVKDLLPELEPEKTELSPEKKEKKRQLLTPGKDKKRESVMGRLQEKKAFVQEREEQRAGKVQHPKKKHHNISIE